MDGKIEEIMEILRERYPEYVELNEIALRIGVLPEDLNRYLNKNKERFRDIEVHISWDGKKMLRLNL